MTTATTPAAEHLTRVTTDGGEPYYMSDDRRFRVEKSLPGYGWGITDTERWEVRMTHLGRWELVNVEHHSETLTEAKRTLANIRRIEAVDGGAARAEAMGEYPTPADAIIGIRARHDLRQRIYAPADVRAKAIEYEARRLADLPAHTDPDAILDAQRRLIAVLRLAAVLA